MMSVRAFFAAAAVAAVGVVFAEDKVLWVDAANYGRSGLDGLSEARAYGTIQDAIDAAEANWTIKVKPGVYDKGGRVTTDTSKETAAVSRAA